ncbi:DUF4397 domain-containing protein [Pedobacter rhodius]|uniref:DUF4397 domain-containing protein n=1 Tax=Pedobacter rhodius TaxID=3004098 RepID=A0ABT4KY01_9SPHI|nr:DUF4397 domain-containing protein [Pedobacter sp. SJ11]MCZ4223621.1 DUF4397 domain-containing protein [Pedobacter sp. SJ11]
MKTSTTAVLKFYILLLTFSVGFLSCKKNDPDVVVKGQAKIKVINAIQTDIKQDVYVDNEKLTSMALAFGETSEYVKIPSGTRNLTFTGTNSLNTDTNLNFTPALTYSTFLVSDRNGNREIVNYEDNLSVSDMANPKIRFINLTPYFNTGINVSIQTGSPFVNALLFKEASNYFTLEAGADLKYNVVGSGNIKTILASELLPGKIYSIWFSGLTSATLQAHLIVDN